MRYAAARFIGFTAATAGLLLGASAAQASMVLSIDDLGTAGIDVLIVDDADGAVGTATAKGASNTADGAAGDGLITFFGAVGAFSVNVTTGVSKPLIGPSEIDLNSINISGGAGTLEIMLTDTDFSGPSPLTNVKLAIGGTTDGTVDAEGFADAGNVEFGMADSTGMLSFTPLAFSGATGASASGLAPYSLSALVRITHTGSGQITSLDANVSIVPEPVSLGLLGIGLLGLGWAGRKRVR